ncbi:hypothetical protein PIB30_057109 [Stylosanthes scabra]|uniref:Uncharacterized protein n=1 Tax=Stylosanthes scabra TaxID=79078 RepID=A0ABU6YJQ6_9FABA|nr:hypothetical protein [Stylosanthes scabra]
MPSLTRAKNGQTRVKVRKLVDGDESVVGDFSECVVALFHRTGKELESEKVGLSEPVRYEHEADNGGSHVTPASTARPGDVQETVSPMEPVERENVDEVEGRSDHVSPFTRCLIPRLFLPSLCN